MPTRRYYFSLLLFIFFSSVQVGETRRQDDVLVVRSGRVLTLSEWHSVRVGRYRRKLYLWVDGMVNYAVLQPPEGISAFENLIYFGESAPFVNNSIIAGRLFVFKLLLILWTKKSPVYCLGVPSSLIFLKKFLDFSMFSTPGRVIKKKKK